METASVGDKAERWAAALAWAVEARQEGAADLDSGQAVLDSVLEQAEDLLVVHRELEDWDK